jgi:UDP-glucose 4-epimerase
LRILVTGGAGYIGCQVVLRLSELGHDVTTFDNLSSGRRETSPAGDFIVGDIRQAAEIGQALRQCDAEAVFHLAAASDLRESIRDPKKYAANNIQGTKNVAEACLEAGVRRLVFSSSAAVYGAPGADPAAETSPLRPLSPYGDSKLAGERILADCAARSDLTYVALRFFNVAGADPAGRCGESTPQAWHLIKLACQAATGSRRDGLTIFGADHPTDDGTCVRDYVHVDDVAQAHIKSLDYLVGGGIPEILNVGYGHGASVRQIVDRTKTISGREFAVRIGAARQGDPPILVADAGKIRQVLGWAPDHDDLDVIIRSALAWEKKLLKIA